MKIDLMSKETLRKEVGRLKKKIAKFEASLKEQKRMKEELAKSEAKYRSLIEKTGAGMAMADAKGKLIDVNKAVCEMFGYSEKELIGKPIIQFLHPEERKRILKFCWRAWKHPRQALHLEFRVIHKKGHTLHLYSRPTVFFFKKKIAGFYAVLTDITERKRAEEELKMALKEKDVLLREVHHRVKNNMQIISSLLRLQSMSIKDEEMQKIFQVSQTRIRSMALIHEKLYQSKDLTRIDFGDYIRILTTHLFYVSGANTALIRLNLDVSKVKLDMNRAISCGLIINELVSNALKHAFPEEKKGTVTIEMHPTVGYHFTLIVGDDGVGLPGHVDIQNPQTLGLQIVADLVKQIDGTLELDQKAGTTFRVAF